MTTTWVICGAGRGVGKTRLALKLCEILPDSIYAKCGGGRPSVDKPPNFFRTQRELASFLKKCGPHHEHVVVESNGVARKSEGDIIIYVDGIAGRTNTRSDANELRAKAHLRISPGASSRQWQNFLSGKLADRALCRAVCRALTDQKAYLRNPGATVRSKVWFVAGDKHVFGIGLGRLLDNVDRFGSLRAAAQAAGMSYRYAWGSIKTAEKHLGKKLIEPQVGGVGGGRSSLAAEGRRLLDVFKQLNKEVADFADERFAALYGEKVRREK